MRKNSEANNEDHLFKNLNSGNWPGKWAKRKKFSHVYAALV